MLLPSFLDFSKTVATVHVYLLFVHVSVILDCKDRTVELVLYRAHHSTVNIWAINSILFDYKDQNYTV